jgi:hypothetical protein
MCTNILLRPIAEYIVPPNLLPLSELAILGKSPKTRPTRKVLLSALLTLSRYQTIVEPNP